MAYEREAGGSRATINLTSLRHALLTWGRVSGRSFPWRETANPFHILIAEMMLRRTQARQVVPVYEAFIATYPDATALANASAEAVAKALYPLGLAWRVPAFHALARALVEDYAGQVPPDYSALKKLPGIGDYVAAAVCCFAFGQAVILADTNTVRVAGRIAGVPTNAESRRRKAIRQLLEQLLDPEHPRDFNLALLDLAALICLPVRPRCLQCPIAAFCSSAETFIHDGLAQSQ